MTLPLDIYLVAAVASGRVTRVFHCVEQTAEAAQEYAARVERGRQRRRLEFEGDVVVIRVVEGVEVGRV